MSEQSRRVFPRNADLIAGTAPHSVADRSVPTTPPSLGIILIGGALVGAQVRDIRLANELVRRGYPVHVWWAMDRAKDKRLDERIHQHWLYQSTRYGGYGPWGAYDELQAKLICRFTPDALRARILQQFPRFYTRQIQGTLRQVCNGVEKDRGLMRRFAKEMTAARITHMLPTLEFLAPFAIAARQKVPHPVKCLVTFQGYELYGNYAREIGLEQKLYDRLRETVADSEYPAIGVSPEYCRRINQDIGVPPEQLTVIPPGIPTAKPLPIERAKELVQARFEKYRPNVPMISFVGRRDSEKGLDLLLYAAKILSCRGIDFQLAICGPTAFGQQYRAACEQIGENLRIPVLWSDFVSDELRSALFRSSHAVVYPSIHEEPFGMVPVEAMALGTPAVVPDTGGVSGAIRAGKEIGGLQFRSWDTRHLADQLQNLITDSELHQRLSEAGPRVADYYSVERLGERVLDHLRLPRFFNGTHDAENHKTTSIPAPHFQQVRVNQEAA